MAIFWSQHKLKGGSCVLSVLVRMGRSLAQYTLCFCCCSLCLLWNSTELTKHSAICTIYNHNNTWKLKQAIFFMLQKGWLQDPCGEYWAEQACIVPDNQDDLAVIRPPVVLKAAIQNSQQKKLNPGYCQSNFYVLHQESFKSMLHTIKMLSVHCSNYQ